ncbi:single-stranded DNA-binding protein [Streptomyces sp. NPDC014882]|uniref:single-stranded DNA-binding protein n=1 Tax=Streptomyces sp. NPDC014882 TaxID=3364927 RepID=UPI0036F844AB
MNETMVCAVGNVATQPVYRELSAGASARFRLAVTSRYWDREKSTWADGHTNFFTVWANRQLAMNVAASLNVGEAVIVQGRLKVRAEAREGQNRTSADIDAVAIGHDLTRGTSAFRRTARAEPATAVATATAVGAPAQPEPDWHTPAGQAPVEQAPVEQTPVGQPVTEPGPPRRRRPAAVT